MTQIFPSTKEVGDRVPLEQESDWELHYAQILTDLFKHQKALRTNSSVGQPPNSSSEELFSNLSYVLQILNDTGATWHRYDHVRTSLIVVSYIVLIIVSLLGNLLVCHIVLRTRRLHTVINAFLVNMATSDLLMTCLNIPFSVARVLLDNWPFSATMCHLVPLVQGISVYVSALTMIAIAVERYQVIVFPLRPRMELYQGAIVVALVWVTAIVVSVPHGLFNEVVSVFTYRRLTRCQVRYPSPPLEYRRWLTSLTFVTQYALPLAITGAAYARVSRRVWARAATGAPTRRQRQYQVGVRRKTTKMLMLVVCLFAVCWLPLHTYHLYVDWSATEGPQRHSQALFFACHWLAMSNGCYNPFIYFWFNARFREGAQLWLTYWRRKLTGGASAVTSPIIPTVEVPLSRLCHRQQSETCSSSSAQVPSATGRPTGLV